MVEKKRQTTRFTAEKDGFAFINRFEGIAFVKGLDKLIDPANTVHGLCGGMCFAALDHFHEGKSIPEASDIPAKGSGLYAYLAARQSESWGVLWSRVLQYARRMFWNPAKAAAQNALAWEAIRASLDRGAPVVLGLVYSPVKESLKLTANHQVIAYGYTLNEDGAVSLDLYDPNCGRKSGIRLALSPATAGFTAEQVHGKKKQNVYTFFVVPYKPKKPTA